MRLKIFLLSLLSIAVPATVHAQSYSPKEIRFEGANAYAAVDLLATSGLKPGHSLTTREIEAALQRLADTGLFSDTRYTVNVQVLILKLTPVVAQQMLPLQYGNFVWWPRSEITALVHARVPLFQGSVPINGGLLDSVKQALVAILAEKGITASVDSMSAAAGPGTPVTAITVTISSPEIKLGDIRFDGASPASAAELAKIRAKVSGDDFDEFSTPKSLINDTEGIYRDDGYLDIAADSVAHGAPRADGTTRFLIDLSVKVHGDELYHVASAEVHAAAPVSVGDLQKALQIKAGDTAGVYELRTAELRLEAPYRRYGYLDADVHLDMAKDAVAHRVGYTFTMIPGEQYHVASVASSGFTPDQQAEFERSFHLAPSTIFGDDFFRQIGMLNQRHPFDGTRIQPRIAEDRKLHNVAVTLTIGRMPVH